VKVSKDYRLFLKFIDYYQDVGFDGIKKSDPLLQEMHALMKKNKQYFYIADMLQLRILYTCQTVHQVLGIEPSQFNPAFLFTCTHPDDISRHSISRARMFQLCHDMFIESINTGKEKYAVMSTSMRYRHADGHYINFLVQGYAFTTSNPVPTTYALFVNTDISWFGPLKHGYNYYIGDDLSYFRIPDKKLILTGCIFTDREFEIIKMIREGLHSEEIGKKLFISPHTVDTHRRNILKKTDKATTSELIIDLQEKGFF
jgi:DNA-binding CsgD family transcriptional regulator